MFLDTSNFPLVRLHMASATPEWESEFAALFARCQRFVLLSVDAPATEREAAPGERKQHALWLKRNRPALVQWCAGAVIVQANRPLAIASRVMAPALTKAFGFPVKIVEREVDIDAEVEQLLG